MSSEREGARPFSRRALLRTSAAAAAGAGLTGATGTAAAAGATTSLDQAQAEAHRQAAAPEGAGAASMIGVPFEKHKTVRLGMIGLGNRGSSMLRQILAVPGMTVTAVCDTRNQAVKSAVETITSAGDPTPATYGGSEDAYEKLCQRDDVDFVYIASPWEWHQPMAMAGMRSGKHVGVECPMATTLPALWELVLTSESTRKHCIQLENCCYGRNELRVLRMAHEEKFGTLLYGAGAYLHDLRQLLFSDTYYADEWRRQWHTTRDGDLYPTHGLGPVASYMNINRGDRLLRLTSMSTPAAGLAEYRAEHEQRGDSSLQEEYVSGDATFSLIQTEQGRVIHLMHDVSNPRPYSRLNHLGGTKGVFEDYPPRIYLEPEMSDDQWGDFDRYSDYDHWLWREVEPRPGGHGGMDYIMLYRLSQTLRLGLPPDIDVYDSATWSAPFALSAMSVANRGIPMPYPDFTRGRWREPHPGTDSEQPSQ